jgi:hypothetical protein
MVAGRTKPREPIDDSFSEEVPVAGDLLDRFVHPDIRGERSSSQSGITRNHKEICP